MASRVVPPPESRSAVIDALSEWFVDHLERGGEFCVEALQAAGDAAHAAELAGFDARDCFEAGRVAYLERAPLRPEPAHVERP